MKNKLFIGPMGAKKIQNHIMPIMQQTNASFIISDPHGIMLDCMAYDFLNRGYTVRQLDIKDINCSAFYNPLNHIYNADGTVSENKAEYLAKVMLDAVSRRMHICDPVHRETLCNLLTFIFMYVVECLPEEQHNLYQALKVVQSGLLHDETSELTVLEHDIELANKQHPDAKCFGSYYRSLFPYDVKNMALHDAGMILTPFAEDILRKLTSVSRAEDIHLEAFRKKPTVLFIVQDPIDDASAELYHVILAQMQREFQLIQGDYDVVMVLDEYILHPNLINKEAFLNCQAQKLFYFISAKCQQHFTGNIDPIDAEFCLNCIDSVACYSDFQQ